jgi:integrase
MRFDTRTVAGLELPAGKTDHIEWDDDLVGFGVRLRAGGRRSWVVQYHPNGRTRRVTLGVLEKLTPVEARAAARKLLASVALGHDPQAEKEAMRLKAAHTFAGAAEAYLTSKRNELRPISYKIAKLYLLDGDYFRPLHKTGVNDISHPDLAARLSAIARKRSTHTAGAARRAVSAFFRWMVEEGWVKQNPVIGTRKPADPKPREHVLSDSELVAVWNACGDDDFGRILRLLILLGNRRQEVGGMRWSELDDDGNWSLPAPRAKNDRALTVALPPTALAIIKAVPRTNRDQLFGNRARSGFTSWWEGKQAINQRLGDKVRPWRIHDLRRSVATKMADIGIEPHIIEAALNHYSGHRAGPAGVYNRARYERQIRAALLRWDEHVTALIEGRKSKVVPLHV